MNTFSNYYRFCHRLFRNAASARSYTSNLKTACERAEENGYTSFLYVADNLLEGQIADMRRENLIGSHHASAIRKFADYRRRFRRAA